MFYNELFYFVCQESSKFQFPDVKGQDSTEVLPSYTLAEAILGLTRM